MNLIDPMTIAHARYPTHYRGHRDIKSEEVNLAGWEPYATPGLSGPNATHIRLDAEWVWYAYTKREEDGSRSTVAFERPITEADSLALFRPMEEIPTG